MIYEFLPSRILASELSTCINKKVTITGWLHKKRSLGTLTFLLVRDRSGLIQVVIESLQEANKLAGLYQGTILLIEGTVKQEARAPQGVEIHTPFIHIEVPVTTPSPIEIDKPIHHTLRLLIHFLIGAY